MDFNWISIAPHLALTAAAFLVIGIDLISKKAGRFLAPWLTILGSGAALWLALRNWGAVSLEWYGTLISDGLFVVFAVIFTVSLILVVLFSIKYKPLDDQERFKPEYYGLLLLITVAMMFMASSADLILTYVALEFSSIMGYVLVGYLRREKLSGEAGIKYFLYGASASAVMLLGFALLYGLTGTTNLTEMVGALPYMALSGGDFGSLVILPGTPGIPGTAFVFLAFGLIMVGLGYKISAVPFHMWAPDAYTGAPTPIAAFLSVASKASGFAVILRFILLLHPSLDLVYANWIHLISVLAILSMVAGAVIGLWQKDVKRIIAYSSIAHAGFILLGVVADNDIGLASIFIYLLIYVFMNIGAFGLVAVVGHMTGGTSLDQFRGLGKRHPLLAALMVVFFLSLAGIPPLAGFFAKFYVLAAVINTGHILLAVVAIMASVVALFLYARVFKVMYFDKAEEVAEPRKLGWAAVVALIICLLGTLAPGIYPEPLVTWVREAVRLTVM